MQLSSFKVFCQIALLQARISLLDSVTSMLSIILYVEVGTVIQEVFTGKPERTCGNCSRMRVLGPSLGQVNYARQVFTYDVGPGCCD